MSKPPRQKEPKGSRNYDSLPKITDERFTNIAKDARFRLPSRKTSRVNVDERFSRMLHDDSFSGTAKVDRYGRKLLKSGDRRRDELRRYYQVGDDDEEKEREGEGERLEKGRVRFEIEPKNSKLDGEDSDDTSDDTSESESSESSASSEDEEEEVFATLEAHQGEEADIPQGEISSRLAVVNLDWDHIRAADLMAVFSSFSTSDGSVRRISIYPSEFGRERMDKEEVEGPPKEIFEAKKVQETERERYLSEEEEEEEEEEEDAESSNETSDNDPDQDDETIKQSLIKEDSGIDFNSAKLRRYQLERLRYYYAVIECSNATTAQTIYNAVDGTEYLTSANFFDLRFIPDSTDFSDDRPRDECAQLPTNYRPNDFVTDALQHSRVKLTWDADDKQRKEAQRKAFSGSRADIDENDLKAYLGSDSSDDEGASSIKKPVIVDATTDIPLGLDTESNTMDDSTVSKTTKKNTLDAKAKMRALLGLPPEPTTKKSKSTEKPTDGFTGDLQVTFTSALDNDDGTETKGNVFENTPEEAMETTAERYIRKEKERKARRKEKAKAVRNGDGSESDSAPLHNQAESTKDLGFNDPFFATSDAKPTTTTKKHTKKEPDLAKEKEKAHLQTLVSDSQHPTMNHFDITALARAEKAASRKQKLRHRVKLSARDHAALEMKAQDHFTLDVDEGRFGDVFRKPEYAIDPTHPRFLGTEGMRGLLDEGRKRREKNEEGDENGDRERRDKKRKKKEGGVDDLVESVKRKVKH